MLSPHEPPEIIEYWCARCLSVYRTFTGNSSRCVFCTAGPRWWFDKSRQHWALVVGQRVLGVFGITGIAPSVIDDMKGEIEKIIKERGW